MPYKVPKSIASHPGVKSCEYGPDIGFDDYTHAVWLKDGWVFEDGNTMGCRCGNFVTVADFKFANPIRRA